MLKGGWGAQSRRLALHVDGIGAAGVMVKPAVGPIGFWARPSLEIVQRNCVVVDSESRSNPPFGVREISRTGGTHQARYEAQNSLGAS